MSPPRLRRTSSSPRRRPLYGLAVSALVAAFASAAAGQLGGSREAMWPAPTAEDWKRPCLIRWQRTYEDALQMSEETGKPILVCVNMDGEIASEHYAGIRYRDPEIARLYEPYVTVIASVYRHTPRDYDEQGRRVLCPRFGSVTCGEHIAIEPVLFEKFLDDRRIAPRHIGVELDGQEMYDVYYAFDTDSVFDAIREGIENRPPVPPTPPKGERSLVERVASMDSFDRDAVEQAYEEGNRARQRAMLEAAIAMGAEAPVDLLRLAVLGFDAELSELGRRALAQSSSTTAVDLIVEVLSRPLPTEDRDALVAALVRLGQKSPRARTFAVVHQGLARGSSAIDTVHWLTALDGGDGTPVPVDREAMEALLSDQDAILASSDPDALLRLAAAFLDFAWEQPEKEAEFARLLFMDARHTARRAEELGATGWALHASLAIADYYLGDIPQSHARALQAFRGGNPAVVEDWSSMVVLAIFAQARQEAIKRALQTRRDWPAQWLADVHAACSLLARHPEGTADQIVAHYDFLRSLRAKTHARRVLEEGLSHFPDSWELHDRLRQRILVDEGLDRLEPTYEAMLAVDDAAPHLRWFAGRASSTAAEFHRRQGDDERADEAYARAIAHFEKDIELDPERQSRSDRAIAMALGGAARIAFEQGDYPRAVEKILASFERRPDAAATLDGLNLSAVDTAKMLLARLVDRGERELAGALREALRSLDPKLLELPAYEKEGPLPGRRRRGP